MPWPMASNEANDEMRVRTRVGATLCRCMEDDCVIMIEAETRTGNAEALFEEQL